MSASMSAAKLLPVADALARMLDGVAALSAEDVALLDAPGRTLCAPITAKLTQPPFDASAMDGYAVRAADVATGATTLRLAGEAAAGVPAQRSLKAGEAMRIFTGAPIPAGADAVVIQENTTAEGGTVNVQSAASVGQNIRPRGQDFAEGEMLLRPGRRLGARDILLAASAGHAALPCVRRPTVALLATGNELVEPGQPLGPGQIVSSNSYGLAAMVAQAGGQARLIPTARDNAQSLAAALAAAADADILVTIGGASVGDHDLVRPALNAAGADIAFYKIAMRPGKPMFFGTRPRAGASDQRCVGLPGNPVSAAIAARVFLVPLIARLAGRDGTATEFTGSLGCALPANGPRDHFMRATLDASVSPPRVTPQSSQDSSLMKALAAADCLIVVPANAPALVAGSPVRCLALDF